MMSKRDHIEPCPECGGASVRYCRTCKQPQDTCNHSGNYLRRVVPSVAASVYESAVKGRQDFRRAFREADEARHRLIIVLRDFLDGPHWRVDSGVEGWGLARIEGLKAALAFEAKQCGGVAPS